jgi:hypothetical protein
MPLTHPYQYVRLCGWAGLAMLFISLFFWAVLGHNMPPFSPALDAQAFADEFRPRADMIRIAMTVMTMGGVMYMIWGVAMAKIMEPIERANNANNMLSTLQLWGAGMTSMFFIIGTAIWLAATFRAETMPPDVLLMLQDLGWMAFDISAPTASVQFAAFGICMLGDRRGPPLIPKWICWFAIYEAGGLFLLGLMPFFKAGAFARDGAINFWIVFLTFFVLMLVCSIAVLRAVPRLEAEYAAQGRAGA